MTIVDVAVVGGGIIGRSVASSASRRGMTVTLLEPGGATEGSSAGNAGHLVPSHVVPFAAPGMVAAGLRSLVSRDGAFAVSRHAGLGIVPWLWQFARSSTAANVERGVPALRTLLDVTVAELDRLTAAGADLDGSRDGLLQVCSSSRSLREMEHEAELFERWGVRARMLSASDVLEREPRLRDVVTGGLELPDDGRFDPAKLLEAVWAEAESHGATRTDARVHRIEPIAPRHLRVVTDGGLLEARQVVVAAGVWSPDLCRPFAPALPIVAARGNSVTLPVASTLRRPLLLVDQRLAINPLAAGLRVTGRFELTGSAQRGVSPARSRQLVRLAAKVLDLPPATEPAQPWTGLRPATPDGLPVIGRLPEADDIVVAAGHGMLGSTSGPGTGEAVAAILTGDTPLVDDDVVGPGRFAHRRRNG